MKKILPLVLVLIAAYLLYQRDPGPPPAARTPTAAPSTESVAPPASIIVDAFRNRQSDVQVQATGTIARVLPDDREGSRHQRFLVVVAPAHTVLIAHNIDLAPRVPDLQPGETIEFAGEYEWNERGGVVHWTHRDPKGRHPAGWLDYRQRRYQ